MQFMAVHFDWDFIQQDSFLSYTQVVTTIDELFSLLYEHISFFWLPQIQKSKRV